MPAPVQPPPEQITWKDWAEKSPAELQDILRTLMNEGDPDLAGQYARMGLEPYPDAVLIAEGDLDGDGTVEMVTTPKYAHPINGSGAIYVVYRKGERHEVDRSQDRPPGSMPLEGVRLHAVTDLTGDGRPEIIWSSSALVAHSPPSVVFVSQWAPGAITNVPGSMGMLKMTLAVDGREILLSGGGIGGGSSGLGQPIRTDHYRWVDGAFRLVERTLVNPQSLGYTWLMQGISDEDLGRPERAAAAYRQVLEPDREIFPYHTTLPEGNEVMQPRFEAAVRSLARFRLGLLLLGTPEMQSILTEGDGLPKVLQTASTREGACTAASAWMREHPEFERDLNSLIGYVHPHWTPDNVCGALHDATNSVSKP